MHSNGPKPDWRRPLITLSILALAVVMTSMLFRYISSRHSAPSSRPAVQTESPAQSRDYANIVERRAVERLQSFDQWLATNNAKGFIGEFGWPAGGADQSAWQSVATAWTNELKRSDLWATAWATGSHWSADYKLAIYRAADDKQGVSQQAPQAEVLEQLWGDANASGEYGLNVAGMEFGSQVTAQNTGTAGQDYFYEPPETFAYLAQRGVKLVRLPVTWERIQPELYGTLKQSEIGAIKAELDAAASHNIGVLLDLHNYGSYNTGSETIKLGQPGFGAEALSNVWEAVSSQLGDHPALLGYSLMNEPHDLFEGADSRQAAKKWEDLTQQVVSSLRGSGYQGILMVRGYDWSSIARWSTNHPTGWIKDPLNNFRYEAHAYWDANGSGTYGQTFDEERKNP